MLVIAKRKLYPARGLMWGGLALIVVSLFFTSRTPGIFVCLLFGGFIVSIVGGCLLDGLYRCPSCGHQLTIEGARFNALLERYARHCPGCGNRIDIDIV